MWSTVDILEAVAEGLRQRAAQDDAEQAVYGLDSLDELGLHPLIQESLRRGGWGVWPEERYPSDRVRPLRSEGRRCDIVLTPAPSLPLRDPMVKDTLFDRLPACDAEEAYWLEVKTVAQFQGGGPFTRYSAELLQPVADDVRKLWGDGGVRHGGLLLVLFVAGPEVAEHDLLAWHRRCLDRHYPVQPAVSRGFPITERSGNAWCGTALFGVRGG